MAGLLATWGHGHGLLPMAISESMTLQQPGSVLMSMAPVAIEANAEAHSPG